MALLDKVRNIASALGKTSWNPVRPGIQMLPPVKLQAPKLSGTARVNLSSMGSNVSQYFRPQTGTLATQGRQFLSKPIPQSLQPVNRTLNRVSQSPIMQFGAGLIQEQNLGLGNSPLASPQSTLGKIAYGTGSFAGAMNPKGLTQRVIRPIVGATNPIISKAISPVASKAIGGRIAAGIGNVAQGAAINPLYGRKPLEGAALDFATGVAFGPNQFISKAKGFTMNRRTFDELVEAEDMIKRPEMFMGKFKTGATTEKEALKAIQAKGLEIVERLSAKYLPTEQLGKTKNVQQQIKALTDLHYQNKLANMPEMGIVDKKAAQSTIGDIETKVNKIAQQKEPQITLPGKLLTPYTKTSNGWEVMGKKVTNKNLIQQLEGELSKIDMAVMNLAYTFLDLADWKLLVSNWLSLS